MQEFVDKLEIFRHAKDDNQVPNLLLAIASHWSEQLENNNNLEQLAHHILEFPVFESFDLSKISISVLLEIMQSNQDERYNIILLALLSAATHDSPNLLRNLIHHDALSKLMPFIAVPHLSHASQHLLCELVKIDEIPYSELEEFMSYIPYIFQSVVDSSYVNELETETSLFLLVALNDQFSRKSGLDMSVLNVLADFKRREISEALVLLYNRCIAILIYR